MALSTSEAEYITLSQVIWDLIPLLSLVEELYPVLKLTTDKPDIHWNSCGYENGQFLADLFQDNRGAYELAKAPKMRPQTKHIAIKYYNFRKHVANKTIRIHPIGTKELLFTGSH